MNVWRIVLTKVTDNVVSKNLYVNTTTCKVYGSFLCSDNVHNNA